MSACLSVQKAKVYHQNTQACSILFLRTEKKKRGMSAGMPCHATVLSFPSCPVSCHEGRERKREWALQRSSVRVRRGEEGRRERDSSSRVESLTPHHARCPVLLSFVFCPVCLFLHVCPPSVACSPTKGSIWQAHIQKGNGNNNITRKVRHV